MRDHRHRREVARTRNETAGGRSSSPSRASFPPRGGSDPSGDISPPRRRRPLSATMKLLLVSGLVMLLNELWFESDRLNNFLGNGGEKQRRNLMGNGLYPEGDDDSGGLMGNEEYPSSYLVQAVKDLAGAIVSSEGAATERRLADAEEAVQETMMRGRWLAAESDTRQQASEESGESTEDEAASRVLDGQERPAIDEQRPDADAIGVSDGADGGQQQITLPMSNEEYHDMLAGVPSEPREEDQQLQLEEQEQPRSEEQDPQEDDRQPDQSDQQAQFEEQEQPQQQQQLHDQLKPSEEHQSPVESEVATRRARIRARRERMAWRHKWLTRRTRTPSATVMAPESQRDSSPNQFDQQTSQGQQQQEEEKEEERAYDGQEDGIAESRPHPAEGNDIEDQQVYEEHLDANQFPAVGRDEDHLDQRLQPQQEQRSIYVHHDAPIAGLKPDPVPADYARPELQEGHPQSDQLDPQMQSNQPQQQLQQEQQQPYAQQQQTPMEGFGSDPMAGNLIVGQRTYQEPLHANQFSTEQPGASHQQMLQEQSIPQLHPPQQQQPLYIEQQAHSTESQQTQQQQQQVLYVQQQAPTAGSPPQGVAGNAVVERGAHPVPADYARPELPEGHPQSDPSNQQMRQNQPRRLRQDRQPPYAQQQETPITGSRPDPMAGNLVVGQGTHQEPLRANQFPPRQTDASSRQVQQERSIPQLHPQQQQPLYVEQQAHSTGLQRTRQQQEQAPHVRPEAPTAGSPPWGVAGNAVVGRGAYPKPLDANRYPIYGNAIKKP